MRTIAAAPRSIEEALGLGGALLARAAAEGAPWIAASVIEGPAIVIGSLARAGRVVAMDAARAAGVRVLRRATSGTAVYIGRRALLWTLALPHVAALASDATPRTLLNRNVRGFLKGLSRAGAVAHYFGREWISVKHRPAALLGFEVTEAGAVLIEVIAGVDAPLALPPELSTEAERGVDRWLGKDPAALEQVLGQVAPEVVAAAVVDAVAKRAAVNLMAAPVPAEAAAAVEVTDALDPLPAGARPGPLVKVPIGWVEAAVDPATGRVWLGGDVLAPRFVIQAIAAAAGGEMEAFPPWIQAAPIEGAALPDLVGAARAALEDAARR